MPLVSREFEQRVEEFAQQNCGRLAKAFSACLEEPGNRSNDGAAGSASPAAEYGDDEADWLCSKKLATLQVMLFQTMDKMPTSDVSLRAWAVPLADYGIVPSAARLLQRVVDSHRAFLQQRAAGQLSARAHSAMATGLAPNQFALETALGLCVIMGVAKRVLADVNMMKSEMKDFGAMEPVVAAAVNTLWSQLRTLPVLRAQAVAVRWATETAGIRMRGAAEQGAGVQGQRAGGGTGAAAQGSSELSASDDNKEQLARRGFKVLNIVAHSLVAVVETSNDKPCKVGPAVSPAAASEQGRVALQNLKDSGLLAAVSDAIVATAPACAAGSVVFGSDTATRLSAAYNHALASGYALQSVYRAMTDDTGVARRGAEGKAAEELVSTPEVRLLRLTALQQMAASAPRPPPPGVDGLRRFGAVNPGASASPSFPATAPGAMGRSATVAGTGASSRQSGRVAWPMLDPEVLRAKPQKLNVTYSLADSHLLVVNALWAPLAGLLGKPRHEEAGSETGIRDVAPPEAAREQDLIDKHLPPLLATAPLAAQCCRAVLAEAEVQGQVLTQAQTGASGSGAAATAAAAIGAAQKDLSSLYEVAGAFCQVAKWRLDNAVEYQAEWDSDRALQADAAVPDGLEMVGCWLRVQVLAGNGASGRMQLATLTLETWIRRWKHLSAANKEQAVRRLLPTRLLPSLDCRLRQELAGTLPDAPGQDRDKVMDRDSVLRLSIPVLAVLMEPTILSHMQQRLLPRPPSINDASSSSGSGSGSAEGTGPWLQEDLGLAITLAKAVRQEPLDSPLDAWVVSAAAEACKAACRALTQLHEGAGNVASGGGGRHEAREREIMTADLGAEGKRVAVALQEVTALNVQALAPLLSVLLGDDSALPNRNPRAAPAGRQATEGVMPMVIVATSKCLVAAAAVLPPEELLALAPQRLLALMTRRLQEGVSRWEERQAEAGGSSSSGGGRSVDDNAPWRQASDSLLVSLAFTAVQEGLTAAAAGWLHGDQGQSESLDMEGLAATVGRFGDRYKQLVLKLRAAAGQALRVPAVDGGRDGQGGGGRARASAQAEGSNSRPFADEWILTFARQGTGIAVNMATMRDGDGLEAPLWPPRVLRLCCNLGCRNYSGAAEAAMELRMCGRCKVARYCGEQCQREDWKEGGHKAQCARIVRQRG